MSREEGEGDERRDDVGMELVSFSDGSFVPAGKNGSGQLPIPFSCWSFFMVANEPWSIISRWFLYPGHFVGIKQL